MRACTTCQHTIDQHSSAIEGYARPCCEPACSCLCFTDSDHQLHREVIGTNPLPRNLAWDAHETAVVHRRTPDASTDAAPYRFPMRNDAPVPHGYEKVEVRSDQQMAQIEREAGVVSERRWFDKGSGRGHEVELPPVPRRA